MVTFDLSPLLWELSIEDIEQGPRVAKGCFLATFEVEVWVARVEFERLTDVDNWQPRNAAEQRTIITGMRSLLEHYGAKPLVSHRAVDVIAVEIENAA